jgi:copper chaperone CopZ
LVKAFFILLIFWFNTREVLAIQIPEATIGIDGLTCSMCSFAVEQSIRKLEFVDSFHMDLNENVATIIFKNDHFADFELLVQAVMNAGFSVRFLHASCFVENDSISAGMHIKYGSNLIHIIEWDHTILNKKVALSFIDKSTISAKKYKKYLESINMECYRTMRSTPECHSTSKNEIQVKVFHVILKS